MCLCVLVIYLRVCCDFVVFCVCVTLCVWFGIRVVVCVVSAL